LSSSFLENKSLFSAKMPYPILTTVTPDQAYNIRSTLTQTIKQP
jgi:hypothetical protein